MRDDIERASKMLLLQRAEWCASELERSSRALEEHPELAEADNGTALMASTMREMRRALGEQAALTERFGMGARFLCDLLQGSNESIDALYGGEFDLNQAVKELRAVISAWEGSK